MGRTEIRGTQIKDGTIESEDIASGSIKAGEASSQIISGQPLLPYLDISSDMFLVSDSSDSGALKKSSLLAATQTVSITGINSSNDPGSSYSVGTTDHVILVNTRPTNQGGIDSALTITLPDASDYPGRLIVIKDAAGYANVNSITVQRAGSDTINGVETSISMPSAAGGSFKRFVSDGDSSWHEIGS